MPPESATKQSTDRREIKKYSYWYPKTQHRKHKISERARQCGDDSDMQATPFSPFIKSSSAVPEKETKLG